MKYVILLFINVFVSSSAYIKKSMNTEEDLKDDFADFVVLFDEYDGKITEMFEKPFSGSVSGDAEGSGESGSGTNEQGEALASASGEGFVKRRKVKPIRHMDTGCTCKQKSCECCLDVGIGDISGEACIHAALLTKDLGMKASFLWNRKEIFSKTISVVNPPPLCFSHPLFPLVKVCIRFSDISIDQNQFGGCISLGLQLLVVKKEFKLGCFYSPNPSTLGPQQDQKRPVKHRKGKSIKHRYMTDKRRVTKEQRKQTKPGTN